LTDTDRSKTISAFLSIAGVQVIIAISPRVVTLGWQRCKLGGGNGQRGMLRVRQIIQHYVWAGNVWKDCLDPHGGLQVPACNGYICHPGRKFTDDLGTILRQFSATYDNW